MAKVGDKIRILRMEGEPQYEGRTGTVDLIDDAGQIHGTWGGCAVIPGVDSYVRIHACALCGRDFEGYPNSGAPLKMPLSPHRIPSLWLLARCGSCGTST